MALTDKVVRLYCRVSTEEQAETGYSLAAQQESLELYTRSLGWLIAKRYIDDGYSAKDMNRPKLKELLAEMLPGEVVLVHKLDRLTRSIADLHEMLKIFEHKQVLFKSHLEPFIDTTDSRGRLMLNLLAVLAQWERETISERSALGKKQKVKEGEWAGGPIPFGYIGQPSGKYKRGRELVQLTPDLERAHIVREVYEKYLSGLGMRAICQWLNDERRAYTKSGSRWRVSTMMRLLTNPLYAGFVSHGLRTKSKTETLARGSHDPLVAEDVFFSVREVFNRRKSMAPRQATGNYPLAGLAHCGVCGGRIDGMKRKNSYAYRCYNYTNGIGCGDGTARPLASVSGRIVEANLVEAVEKLHSHPAELNRYFTIVEADNQYSNADVAAETKRLEGEISRADAAIRRWDEAFETGRLSFDDYSAKVQPHRSRIKSVIERLDELKRLPAPPNREELAAHAQGLSQAWGHLNPHERKAILQQFVAAFRVRVSVYPDRRVELR